MKIKNLFAIVLALTLLICICVLPVSAKETTINNEIEVIINDDVSEETKEKIERYFANGSSVTDDGGQTYGLTCTLFGHKLEACSVSTITHKVRSTSPRCLKETYTYQACERCDYETSTLVKTEYIKCCA